MSKHDHEMVCFITQSNAEFSLLLLLMKSYHIELSRLCACLQLQLSVCSTSTASPLTHRYMTSRYLDDLLNIDNIHFEHMVHGIYTAELQLNKANASDTEAAFLDLNLSIHNDIVSTKIYDKRDDFNFDIVNFPFLDGDVPRRPAYGVYILQLILFARASTHVTDFNNRNKFLTAKLLKQGYRYHKLLKAFSKFYRRHFELIAKYHVSLKKLMQQSISNPEFYGDLVYKFKKIIGIPNFSNLFKRIVNRFKRAGYTLDIMRQTACLVFNPIMVEGYAALFSCTAVVQASDSMTASM